MWNLFRKKNSGGGGGGDCESVPLIHFLWQEWVQGGKSICRVSSVFDRPISIQNHLLIIVMFICHVSYSYKLKTFYVVRLWEPLSNNFIPNLLIIHDVIYCIHWFWCFLLYVNSCGKTFTISLPTIISLLRCVQ